MTYYLNYFGQFSMYTATCIKYAHVQSLPLFALHVDVKAWTSFLLRCHFDS